MKIRWTQQVELEVALHMDEDGEPECDSEVFMKGEIMEVDIVQDEEDVVDRRCPTFR